MLKVIETGNDNYRELEDSFSNSDRKGSSEKKDETEKPIAIQISTTRTFAEGSGATWVTTVRQNDSLGVINAVMDKIMLGIKRQELHTRVAAIYNDIELHLKQKTQLEFSLAALKRRHGDFSKAKVDAREANSQTEESLLRINMSLDTLYQEHDRLNKELE
jgi:hypothetical protein